MTKGKGRTHAAPPNENTHTLARWTRTATNPLDACWLAVGRVICPPRIRSRLRYRGYERLALRLDRLCGEDTP